MQVGWLALETQSVVAMRLFGMAGLWSVAPSENSRMVSEKSRAFTQSLFDTQRAVWSGARPEQVAAAALAPIRRTTRANALRLSRRGPRRF